MCRHVLWRSLVILLVIGLMASCGQPAAPSVAPPTPVPTNVPAPTPSSPPTPLPTEEPTAAPTLPPTAKPTAKPTQKVAAIPTSRPTRPPTTPPTAGPTADPAEKIMLRLHLQKGDSYYQKVTTEQVISQTMQSMSVAMTQTVGYGYAYDVQDVSPMGAATVRVTFEWIMVKMESTFGGFEYDSADPPTEMPAGAEVFAGLLGEGFTMTIAPDGSVTEVEGFEQLIENLLDKLGLAASEQADAVREQLRSQYGDQVFAEDMEKEFAIYPDKPVGIGDSWTRKTSLAARMPMIVVTTWTLDARQGGVSTISLHSLIAPPPQLEPIESGGAKLYYQLSGEQTGTLQLDEATGWVIKATTVQHISGKIRMEEASLPEAVSWPVSLDSTVWIETEKR